MKRFPLFCWLIFLLPIVAVASGDSTDSCAVRKLEVERLPDLNIPRDGHQMVYAGGELMVAGGHTDGFVPTQTAEYLKNGEWHVMQMTYSHDFGIAEVLTSGKVLLAGGCEQPTGIGQTFSAEIYDPTTHTFRGFGNMQRKRVWASALELDSGRVVIAGNWYHDDGIELFQEELSRNGDFKGKQSFIYIKDVIVARCTPYIFRMADNNALIIGSISSRGDTLRSSFAERLKGDTLHIPLFETWRPLTTSIHHDEASLIGDETKNDFTYLLPVHNTTGQVAIARVIGTDVQLLPTACAVPMEYQGEQIEYFSNIIVDRNVGRAYLVGISSSYHDTPEKAHLYVLSVDYAKASEPGGAPLTLYYTDSLGVTPNCAPLLTPEGNLLIAGGLAGNSNYTPSAAVFLLRLGTAPQKSSESSMNGWLWAALAAVVLILLAGIMLVIRRRRGVDGPVHMVPDSDLMDRISRLMEEKRLYLDSDLKLTDVASALGTNRNAISSSINTQRNCSFTQFVNTYRVEYAQKLMRQQPDIKISEVWMSSGFSTERTFLRTFKQQTGMTPSDWKSKID